MQNSECRMQTLIDTQRRSDSRHDIHLARAKSLSEFCILHSALHLL
jgi:hypothetical protein